MLHSVKLDGKEVTLKYGPDDRELIEATFPRPDGTPGSMGAMVRGNLIETGSLRVQSTLVWLGVRHQGKAWTYERVREALIKATQNGGLGTILTPTLAGILASGVLGRIVEDKEPEEPVVDDPKAGAGSGEPGSTA